MASSLGDTATSGILSPDVISLTSSVHSSSEISDSYESVSELSSEDLSSDDEIVWSLSDSDPSDSHSPVLVSHDTLSPGAFSDEDIVVLSHPMASARAAAQLNRQYQPLTAPSSVPNTALADNISGALSRLTIAPQAEIADPSLACTRPKRPKKRRGAAIAQGTAAVATPPPTGPAETIAGSVEPQAGPHQSPGAQHSGGQAESSLPHRTEGEAPRLDGPAAYQEAVQYITMMVTNPTPQANSDLKLLHAFIIELELVAPNQVSSLEEADNVLPRTLTAARNLIKSKVFMNVQDYLRLRLGGLDVLRTVMHPSRKALVKSVRKTRKAGRKVSADVAKKSGLGVFLVTCYR